MNHAPIVSREEWPVVREALLIQEKEATRARDQLNAERRRLPMVKIDKEYLFEGRHVTLQPISRPGSMSFSDHACSSYEERRNTERSFQQFS